MAVVLPLLAEVADAEPFIGRGSKGATHVVPSANAQQPAFDPYDNFLTSGPYGMVEIAQAAQQAALPPLCNVTELVAASHIWAAVMGPGQWITFDGQEHMTWKFHSIVPAGEHASYFRRAHERWRQAVQECITIDYDGRPPVLIERKPQ